MYTVVGAIGSRAFRVLWTLEEMGIPFEHIPAKPRSPEALKYTATGKVPALIDGDTTLTDSAAIMTYLADKHGQLTFPPGTIDRAIQDGHMHFVIDEFDACLWTGARHSFVLPEEHRVPAVKDSLKWEFGRSVERFIERLGDGPFLMGDTMTIADIMAVHCATWAKNAGFPVDAPEFAAYVARMTSRPAYVKARAEQA